MMANKNSIKRALFLGGLFLLTCSTMAQAGMGSFGSGGMGGSSEKKKRKAKLQDVLWDREAEGIVRIFCSPPAKLYIDGELQHDPNNKKQLSPKYVAAMKEGKHIVEMKRNGYITEKQEIEIKAGEPYSMNFTLMKEGQTFGGMVLVPAGEFVMGISKGDITWIIRKIGGEERFFRNQLPRHKVNVPAFYIDKYEVTNSQYKEFIDATGHTPPENWKNGSFPPGKATFPVIYVSWPDAAAYAKWAGKRLPTEAEWEKAARGPKSLLYPWGDTFNRNRLNCYNGGAGEPTPVGKYEKGRSHYGAYDMAGNVKEWTSDDFKNYEGNPFKDDFYGLTTPKVAKGGSFFDAEYDCLGSTRFKFSPSTAYDDVGFRCVKDAGGRTEREISD